VDPSDLTHPVLEPSPGRLRLFDRHVGQLDHHRVAGAGAGCCSYNAGRVDIYRPVGGSWATGNWTSLNGSTIDDPSAGSSDYFGYDVAASDTTIAVGAYGRAAYLYDFDSNTNGWDLATRADSPGSPANFGARVGTTGTTLVAQWAGQGEWFTYGAGLDVAPSSSTTDGGDSLALDGATLATTSTGVLDIYTGAGGSWTSAATFTTQEAADDPGALAVSGQTVVVGTATSGKAYVFAGNVLHPLTQVAPFNASVLYGTAWSGQLQVGGAVGGVTYAATSVLAPGVTVGAGGLVAVAAGTPAATYSLSGTDQDAVGDTGTWSLTVTVQPLTTGLRAGGITLLGALFGGLMPIFSATLTAAGGGPVVGQPVVFSIGGTPVCVGTTNSNGIATCAGSVLSLLSLLLSGSYQARFGGSTDYLPSATQGAFTVA
jgi:hypothetical protein